MWLLKLNLIPCIHIRDSLSYDLSFWFSSFHKVYGLKDTGGVYWSGKYGKSNGKELAEARIPSHRYRCVPRVLQGSTRAGCSGSISRIYTYFCLKRLRCVSYAVCLSFLRLWIIQLKWQRRLIVLSPCSPLVPMSSRCTLELMAFSSMSSFCFTFPLRAWCHSHIFISHSANLTVPFINRKVKKGSLLIDSSTIDPAVSKEMASAAEKMGAVFMDAPVSGGQFNILIILMLKYE